MTAKVHLDFSFLFKRVFCLARCFRLVEMFVCFFTESIFLTEVLTLLSNDGKDFIIPWDLLKPVYMKIKERYGRP